MRKEDIALIESLFNINYDNIIQKWYTGPTPVSYPKYNIIKVSDNLIKIDIALAGKSKEDLSVETKDGNVYISCSKVDNKAQQYIYKGISDKEFNVKYPLLETQVVKYVKFKDGLLSIYIENVIPEERKPKKIEIE